MDTQRQDVDGLVAGLYDYRTRSVARRTLAEMPPETADRLLPVLAEAEQPDNVRWAIITLMGKWQTQAAAPILVEIMHSVLGLRSEAARALRLITGWDIGDDPEEWQRALADPLAYAAEQAREEQARRDGTDPGADPGADANEAGRGLFAKALEGLPIHASWEEEDGGYLHLRCDLENERKQQILVTFNTLNSTGRPVTVFYTECGPAQPQTAEGLSRRNLTLKHGKFILERTPEGTDKVVMRATMISERLTVDMTRSIVQTMAREADALEFELTRSDRI